MSIMNAYSNSIFMLAYRFMNFDSNNVTIRTMARIVDPLKSLKKEKLFLIKFSKTLKAMRSYFSQTHEEMLYILCHHLSGAFVFQLTSRYVWIQVAGFHLKTELATFPGITPEKLLKQMNIFSLKTLLFYHKLWLKPLGQIISSAHSA